MHVTCNRDLDSHGKPMGLDRVSLTTEMLFLMCTYDLSMWRCDEIDLFILEILKLKKCTHWMCYCKF